MIFKKRLEISGHAQGIYCLDVFNKLIYSASADGFIARWDSETGTQDAFSINFSQPVYSLKIMGSGKKLIAGLANGDLHVFDLEEKKEIRFFQQHIKAVFCIASNPLKHQWYSGDADGNLAVWSEKNMELMLYVPLDCGKIRRIAVSPDGKYLALGGQDGVVRIMDTEFFNEKQRFLAHKGGVTSMCFSRDSEFLYTGGKDAHLRCWNWKSGEEKITVPAHNYVIYDLILLDEGNVLVSASRDKTIKVWSAEDLRFQQRLDLKEKGHRHSVNSLVKLSESSFVSGSDDKKIIVWETFC